MSCHVMSCRVMSCHVMSGVGKKLRYVPSPSPSTPHPPPSTPHPPQGDDMNFMARSFDKTKRGEATELIKRFQDRVKGAAPAADKKDWEELLAVQKDTIGDINKFFDLLIDAPEDL